MRSYLNAFLARPLALASLAVFGLIVVGAIAAPVVRPYDPLNQDLYNTLSGPTWQHWLGTDSLGRDVLSRLMYGAAPALVGGLEATCSALLIAVPAGLAAGYFGGWADTVIARVADVAMSIPVIVVVLVVLSIFGSNIDAAMLALGLVIAPNVMRVIRAAALTIRRELYIDAAKVSGVSSLRILFRHVLPRVAGPVLVQGTLLSAGAILISGSLGFLGFGPEPPNPSWGSMVQDGSLQAFRQPWLLVPPGAILALTCLSLGIIGDAIRDITADRWSAPSEQLTLKRRTAQLRRTTFSPSQQTALLSVRGLTVAFQTARNQVPVVEDLSFDLNAGETLGIVGESGTGKTITSLAILGLLPPAARVISGECWYSGKDLMQATAREMATIRGKELAMVSQEPMSALDPVFTVESQIVEVIRQHDQVDRRDAKVRAIELLSSVGLPDPEAVARRYPHELSGGMAQRVSIARALAGRPRVLIADEPTTALDVTVQAEILDLLRSLQADTGLAILLITHNWGVIADICQRAVVMYAGQMVEHASVTEVFERPMHPYTEGLMRANPEAIEPDKVLYAIPGTVPSPGDWPLGCRFAERCPYASRECEVRPIELYQPRAGHYSRCIKVEKVFGLRRATAQ